MRTGSRAAVSGVDSGIALVLTSNELEELAKSAPASLLGRERGILARAAHERAQTLRVDARVIGRKSRRGVVVGDQLGAPAFGLVQRERVLCPAKLELVDG